MKKKLSNKLIDSTKLNNNFFERVFEVACKIPEGRVTSYGAIAKCLGSVRSARMVGWAMNQSHFCKFYVPVHRVVNRNGLLTGKHHFENENQMQVQLLSEGIEVIDDKIINFNKYFWDPCKELI